MSSLTDAFTRAIAGWDETLHCELTTAARTRCRRPASWHVSSHGCEQHLMCGNHLRHWLRRVEAALQAGGRVKCQVCGEWFTSIASATSAVRL